MAVAANADGQVQRRYRVRSHRQLEVYRRAYDASMRIFKLTRDFPRNEVYSLTSQILRSSRSVCGNIAEAWRKRRYEAAFVAKVSDAETEAAETRVYLEFAVDCGCMDRSAARELYRTYNAILATLVGMVLHANTWTIPSKRD